MDGFCRLPTIVIRNPFTGREQQAGKKERRLSSSERREIAQRLESKGKLSATQRALLEKREVLEEKKADSQTQVQTKEETLTTTTTPTTQQPSTEQVAVRERIAQEIIQPTTTYVENRYDGRTVRRAEVSWEQVQKAAAVKGLSPEVEFKVIERKPAAGIIEPVKYEKGIKYVTSPEEWKYEEKPTLEKAHIQLDKAGKKLTGAKEAPLAFGVGVAKAGVSIASFGVSVVTKPVETAKGVAAGVKSFVKDPYSVGYKLGDYIQERPVEFMGQAAGYYGVGKLMGKGVQKARKVIVQQRTAEVTGLTTRTTKLVKGSKVASKIRGVDVQLKTYYKVGKYKLFPKKYKGFISGSLETKLSGTKYGAGYETQLITKGKPIYGTFSEVGKVGASYGKSVVRGFIKGKKLYAVDATRGFELSSYLKRTLRVEDLSQVRMMYKGKFQINSILDIKKLQKVPKKGIQTIRFGTMDDAFQHYSMQPTLKTYGGLETGETLRYVKLTSKGIDWFEEFSKGKLISSTDIYTAPVKTLRAKTIGGVSQKKVLFGLQTQLVSPTKVLTKGKPIVETIQVVMPTTSLLRPSALVAEIEAISSFFIPPPITISSTKQTPISLITPKTSPVVVPKTLPVTTPVTTPITTAITTPITAPVTKPMTTPVTVPVTIPVTTPITAPVATPITPLITIPVTVPPPTLLFPLDLKYKRRKEPVLKSFKFPKSSYSYTLWGRLLPKVPFSKSLAKGVYSPISPRPSVYFPKKKKRKKRKSKSLFYFGG